MDSLSQILNGINSSQIKELLNDYGNSQTVISNDNSNILINLTKEVENAKKDIQIKKASVEKGVCRINCKNSERYNLSKKIYELEVKNEYLETSINKTLRNIHLAELEIKKISHPSVGLLFYEIMKGFGVEFVGENTIRIMNKKKNDLYLINIDDFITDSTSEENVLQGVLKIREEIWNRI